VSPLSAKAEAELQRVPLRDFVADFCMCQGRGERIRVGSLVLLVCVDCGKATRERAVRVGDAYRRFVEAQAQA